MTNTIVWLITAGIFGLIEAVTAGLVSIWFIGGALAAALASVLGASTIMQVIIFLVVSLILLVSTRPFLKRKFDKKIPKTNAETLVGTEAIVEKAIREFSPGEVKINGNHWRAVGEDADEGDIVVVSELNGATLTVRKKR